MLAEGAQLRDIDMDDEFADTMDTTEICDHGILYTLSCIHTCMNVSEL